MSSEQPFGAGGLAGFTILPFALFTIASVLSRGARFSLVAALLRTFGPPIQSFVEKNLGWVTLALVVLLIGGFALIKLAV